MPSPSDNILVTPLPDIAYLTGLLTNLILQDRSDSSDSVPFKKNRQNEVHSTNAVDISNGIIKRGYTTLRISPSNVIYSKEKFGIIVFNNLEEYDSYLAKKKENQGSPKLT